MQCQCNARGPLSKLERAPPQRKINVTSKSPVGDISVVTLIRTDTTLDHSQKAEKVCIDTSATFVEPRKCIFSSSFTSREASTSRVAHSTFVCYTQPHCLHYFAPRPRWGGDVDTRRPESLQPQNKATFTDCKAIAEDKFAGLDKYSRSINAYHIRYICPAPQMYLQQ